MAQLLTTTFTGKASATQPAANPTDLVRLQEMQAAISGQPLPTIEAADITDFEAAVEALLAVDLLASATIDWLSNSGTMTPRVRLKSGGYLGYDADGLYVQTGSGGLAVYDHTHAQLHDAATVNNTGKSVVLAVAGQELSGDVLLAPTGRLVKTAAGLSVADEIVSGSGSQGTTITVQNTNSVALSLVSGVLTANVRRDTNPGLTGVILQQSSAGLSVPAGVAGGAALFEHTHNNATQQADGFLSATDKIRLDNLVLNAGSGSLDTSSGTGTVDVEQVVTLLRMDSLPVGARLDGRVRFGTDRQLQRANATASAPQGSVVLALEIDGALMGPILTLPSGSPGTEVTAESDYAGVIISANSFARWKCTSGPAPAEDQASRVVLAMNLVTPNLNAPVITTQPEDQSSYELQTVTFTVAATGTAPLTYQWQVFDQSTTGIWTSIPGETASTLARTADEATFNQLFRCMVNSPGGTAYSDSAAVLLIWDHPVITVQPSDQTAADGATATFTVTATGLVTGYQWYRSSDGGTTWAPMSGATAASLILTAYTAQNGWRYKCAVTNVVGTSWTHYATLTVT